MNVNYYTSDLHLGHAEIVGMSGRPFSCVREMDEALVRNWNSRVCKNDDVYIIGDLIYKSECPPEEYLSRLRGRKHLIFGNHDLTWKDSVDLSRWFVSWGWGDRIDTGQGYALLSHFPLFTYIRKYQIHGHLHNRTNQEYWSFLRAMPCSLNAGVDINGYAPVTLSELVRNNEKFKQEH